jgi:hypothetical protein
MVIELNRAVALAMLYGPAAGLELIDKLTLEPALKAYHLLPSVRGDLLQKLFPTLHQSVNGPKHARPATFYPFHVGSPLGRHLVHDRNSTAFAVGLDRDPNGRRFVLLRRIDDPRERDPMGSMKFEVGAPVLSFTNFAHVGKKETATDAGVNLDAPELAR